MTGELDDQVEAMDNYTYYDDSSSTHIENTSEAPSFIEFQVAQMMWVYVGSAIIAVGTVGHVLSILVLLGSKQMRLLSLTVYLVATSLAGLAALYVGLLRQVVLHESNWVIDVREQLSDIGCRVHAALTYMTLQLYLWLQATIAVERTIAELRPLHYKHWCTWQRNVIVVAVIVVLLGLFNSIVVLVYRIDPEGYCTASPDHKELFEVVWWHLDLLLCSILPVVVIVPCNALTLHAIYGSRSQVDGQWKPSRYTQITVMLVVHNCLCVATTLPISVIVRMPLPSDLYLPAHARRELEWTIFSLLQYLGTTFSFVIYTMSAHHFRRSIVDLFRRGLNASKTSTTSFSSSRRSSGGGSRTSRAPLPVLPTKAGGGGVSSSGSGGVPGCYSGCLVESAEQEHAC